MSYETVILEKKEGVAVLTLNRPEALNALNAQMAQELMQALDEVRRDEEARAVVLTGAGRAFCAGGDVKMMAARTPLEEYAYLRGVQSILRGLVNLDKPVIAAVKGPAVGAGCNLALACDIVIAAENARFSEIFGRVGLVPDLGGMYFLPRLVGPNKAKELIFTTAMVEAQEAHRLGMVNQVVPTEELEAAAMKLATKLAQGPTRAIGLAKSILNRSLEVTLDDILEYEAAAQGLCFASEDHHEGVRAFMEKREPQFKGR